MRTDQTPSLPVAIVGMACRFPGAESVDDLWHVLLSNADTVTEVPDDRFAISDCYDPVPMAPGRTVSRHGGFLTDPFGFDAAFFSISPAEAREMDPQQRLALHVVWEALESAGIRPSLLAGSRGGVFVGQATAEHAETDPRAHEPDIRAMIGGRLRAVTAGRISHVLDLRGPSVVLDTACSSSLVAVHSARQSLLAGESDLCIAAGVNVIMSPHDSIAYSQGGMLSPGGRCRFGDSRADGFVRGEGVGAVVLKRLDDALRDGDPVCAVLLGSATTNDGAASGLLIRPSVEGQADAVRRACASAGIAPSELDYVEAHGTGTHLGDEVELRALAESAGHGRPANRPLLTGSVKTNLGHGEAAAGIAGLIKTVLMLRHGTIPASLHLDEPRPLLAQEGFPVTVVTRNRPLNPAGPGALLGVTSVGLSGTNAHLVVGAPVGGPEPAATRSAADAGPHLLVLSAGTPGSLRRLAARYASYLGPSGTGRAHRLTDICSAAATGRDTHPHRLWVVGDDHDSLSQRLRALVAGEAVPDGAIVRANRSRARRVVFVFSGQGSQWTGMGRSLYRSSPAFRTALDACDRAVHHELGWSVVDRLMSDDELPADVATVQPLLWAVQVALAAAWRERGVEPELCLGHSMGEVAAAHVCGALSLDDAAAVICRRSRLMQRTAGQGAMLVVELPAAQARKSAEVYGDAVCVAAENAPATSVLSGEPAALAALRAELEERGVQCHPVQVNVASHSPQMDALRDDLLRELAGLCPAAGTTDMVSTVSGTALEGPELTASYWMDNLRGCVQFADTVRRVARAAPSVFVEIGPHPVLAAALDATLGGDRGRAPAVGSLRRARDEATELARSAGRLFALGARVDWRQWYGGGPRHVPSLPTYAWDEAPFRREGAAPAGARRSEGAHVRHIDLASWAGATGWSDAVAVHGFASVPPVVYLAALAQTALETDRTASFELRGVRLGEEPVPAAAADGTTLRVTLDGRREDDGHTRGGAVHALLKGASVPVLCASGRVVAAATADTGSGLADRLDASLARCREYLPAGTFHALARRHGYDIRGSLAAVEHLWRRDGEAVARVRLPEPLPHAGWEAGLLPLLAARPRAVSGRDDAWVPVSFDMVRFHAELEAEFWSVSTVRPEAGGAGLLADVVLIAPDRRVLAQFRGIRLRRPAGPTGPGTSPDLVAALVSAFTDQHLAPLTNMVRKVTEPLGRGLLTALLRPVLPPGTDPEGPSAAARSVLHPARPAHLAPTRGAADSQLAKSLIEHSAALLGMAAPDIDDERSLRDLGLDSLTAIQLRQRLRHSHGIDITVGRLLGEESLAGLCDSLVQHGTA